MLPDNPLLRRCTWLHSLLLAVGLSTLLFFLLAPPEHTGTLIGIGSATAALCTLVALVALRSIRLADRHNDTFGKALLSLSTDAGSTPDYSALPQNRLLHEAFSTLSTHLRQQHHTKTLLLNAIRDIGSYATLDEMLQGIAERAQELTGARYTALATFHSDSTIDRFITLGMTEEQKRGISRLPEGKGLLGYIHRTRQSVLTSDLHSHPESSGFPAGHPPMTSLLAVPIISGSTSLGNLLPTSPAPTSLTNTTGTP